jgi:hypothetical protein
MEGGVAFEAEGQICAGCAEGEVVGYYGAGGVCCADGPGEGFDVVEVDE